MQLCERSNPGFLQATAQARQPQDSSKSDVLLNFLDATTAMAIQEPGRPCTATDGKADQNARRVALLQPQKSCVPEARTCPALSQLLSAGSSLLGVTQAACCCQQLWQGHACCAGGVQTCSVWCADQQLLLACQVPINSPRYWLSLPAGQRCV